MKKLLLVFALAVVLVACQPDGKQAGPSTGPLVWIDAPLDGATVALKSYDIVSHAAFPQGISAFELSVNNQVLHVDNVPLNQAQTLVQISQSWTPPVPGTYLLAVRAAGPTGNFGSPSEVHVTVGDASPRAPEEPSPTRASVPPQATVTESAATPTMRIQPRVPSPTSTRLAVAPTATRIILQQPTATFTRRPPTATSMPPPPPPPPPPPTATKTPVPRDTQGPPPPQLTAPTNGASFQCGWVYLNWKASTDPSGIRGYDIEVQRSSGRSAYVMDKSWTDQYSLSVSIQGTCYSNYRWRVRATDNVGNVGSWSGYGTFYVGSEPPR